MRWTHFCEIIFNNAETENFQFYDTYNYCNRSVDITQRNAADPRIEPFPFLLLHITIFATRLLSIFSRPSMPYNTFYWICVNHISVSGIFDCWLFPLHKPCSFCSTPHIRSTQRRLLLPYEQQRPSRNISVAHFCWYNSCSCNLITHTCWCSNLNSLECICGRNQSHIFRCLYLFSKNVVWVWVYPLNTFQILIWVQKFEQITIGGLHIF